MANVITEDKGRLQALERALGQIEKTFGKGSIMRLDSKAMYIIPGISTGAISLDRLLFGRRGGGKKGTVAVEFDDMDNVPGRASRPM